MVDCKHGGEDTMNIAVSQTAYGLIEKAAAREARSAASVVDDAMRLYDELHSTSYKAHMDAARRFRTSPAGSDEHEIAADDLARSSARARGIKVAERGGSLASSMAQLRENRRKRASS